MSQEFSRSRRAESTGSVSSLPTSFSPSAKSRFDEEADSGSHIQLLTKKNSTRTKTAPSSPHYNPIHEERRGKDRSYSMESDDRSSQRNDSDGETFTTRMRRISAPETYDSLVSSLSSMNPSLAGHAEKLKIRVRMLFKDKTKTSVVSALLSI